MRINIKNHLLKKILFVFFILTLDSCNDPIFYTISQEEKQLEPRIKGSPTNFVEFNGNVYVGSGTILYKYNDNGTISYNSATGDWSESTPGGIIKQLAATSSIMYALCEESKKFVLKQSSDGSNWTNVSAPADIQSIYAAGSQLFIGAGTSGAYSILNSSFTVIANTGNKLLNGAASNYLITKDKYYDSGAIYPVTGGTPIRDDIPFMGIIAFGSTTVAIARDGVLYDIPSFSYKGNLTNSGKNKNRASGALATWQDFSNSSSKLLLAGRLEEPVNSVNYLHGYQEIDQALTGNFHDPGNGFPTTVENNAAYTSNMEKNPVNYLIQAPDGILFASTATKGVWSYRLRSGKWQWNAEQ
jgi:hypothetical protein